MRLVDADALDDLVDIKELKKVDVVQIIRTAKTLNDAMIVMNGLAANGYLTLWNNATHKVGTSYRDLITNAPTVQCERWVSVDDRSVPKDNGTYLVANSKRGFVAPYIKGVIHNNVNTNWDWQYGEVITHWQPIPAAPTDTE